MHGLITGSKECLQVCGDSNPTFKENLEREKARLETRLERVNDALKAINSNPEVMVLLEAIQKAL